MASSICNRDGKGHKTMRIRETDAKILYHFVVLDERFEVLLKGHIYEQRNVMLTYRHNAPNDGQVSGDYSTYDTILQIIPTGVLPTIQFGTEETIKEFL